VDIRRLDPSDSAALGDWYAAMRAAQAADRRLPLIVSRQALAGSLRTNDDNPSYDRRCFGAWDGPACLGTALIELPREQNRHLAEVEVSVPPEYRGRGVGAALCDHALAVARAEGRSLIGTELAVPEGMTLRDSPGGRFALSKGCESKHTELRLVRELPLPESLLAELADAAAERSAGYRAVSWTGLPPREWLATLAEMCTLMERDVPVGEVNREPVAYTPERVEVIRRRLLDAGYGLVTTVVLDAAGSPCAYTELLVGGPDGEDVLQDDTFVLREHRGHRLGTVAKTTNLRLLAAEHPRARRVHTYTAPENDAMYAVNARFGFRAVETMHEIELALDE
jgi:GNAT superfamily N-acetyltransferase